MTEEITAVKLPLKGRALIEASAGTGKTWTLTGIILRLLIEDRRPVKEIVASTFTRAAAAEMRQRIQARVQDFRQLLITLLLAAKDDINLLNDDDDLPARVDQYLTQQGNALYCQDDVNRYLLNHILEDGLTGLLSAYRLSELALTDLNKLFVGTLDSLCQRWLREFATETGVSDHVNINEDSEALDVIVHQQLRRIQHDYVQQSALHKEVIASKKLDSHKIQAKMKGMMAFGRVEIQPSVVQAFDEQQSQHAYQALCALTKDDIGDAVAFLNDDTTLKYLAKNKHTYKQKEQLVPLYEQLVQNMPLSDTTKNLAQAIYDEFESEDSPSFNKNGKYLHDPFISLTLFKRIRDVYHWQQLATKYKKLYADAINEQIALEIRQTLPHALEARGEGMFSLQLERLNRVLEGEHGQILARYIAHRYPVMLVDESQDLNHEQAKMLESIYLRGDTHDGFLLLVGDPKQAIYGFRGGDVANYNRLKKQFPKPETLTTNRRSSETIINALNELYLPINCTNESSPPESAILGDEILYQEMSTVADDTRDIFDANHVRDNATIKQPVIWYDVDKAEDDFTHIINIIKTITASDGRYYRVKEGKRYRIRLQDIMVLISSNSKLQTLQRQLLEHGINAQLKANANIFNHTVAHEFVYILSLMLDPYHDGQMRRLLTGRLCRYEFDFTNDDAPTNAQDGLLLNQYRQLFIKAGETWQRYGLLRALQDILTNELNNETLWTRVAGYASPDNLRYLLDMRQCLQILVDKSTQLSPRQLQHWWSAQLADPPNTEWAQMHPLPTQDAVTLLTLHGAKGLQAPVVIVASATNFSPPPPFYQYHDDDGKLYLSFTKLDEAEKKAIEIRKYEKRRLLYVGLTRAEDLLFIGNFNGKNPAEAYKTLYHKQYYETEQTQAVHSQSLNGEALVEHLQTTTPITTSEDIEETLPPQPSKTLVYKSFRGWGKSSFSALLRNYGQHQQDFVILQPDYQQVETAANEADTLAPEEVGNSIRFQFPKGTNSGSFLHETLERLPQVQAQWLPFIHKMLTKYQLIPEENKSDFERNVCTWIGEIIATPLSASRVSIQSISMKDRIHELSFNLGVNDRKPLDLAAISTLFAQYDIAMPLTGATALTRFIRGEIDLVYRHQGKFYVADYKSNYLGGKLTDYDESNMRYTMDKHQYWLQAALYQLALHRFLSIRLPHYNPKQHLGDVEYAFLRGMSAAQPQYGKFVWQVPLTLLAQLDDILGYQEARHA